MSTSAAPERLKPQPPSDWAPSATAATLVARGQALMRVREFFAQRSVLEVQTPVLGAATVTDPHVEAFALDAGYLQTSSEYHQKRLLAAGVGDNYTLGPVFRSGEFGRLHNPEFTMLEWYRLGFDDVALMAEVQALVDLLLGPGDYQVHRYAGLLGSVELDEQQLRPLPADAHDDLRLSRALEALGNGRHFVVDYPADAAVLARLDPADSSVARRFELVIDGVEIANGYFELADLAVHRERFRTDQQQRAQAGQHVPDMDEALLGAVAAGLPDCSGVALGFDRLFMLQQGLATLAEAQVFAWPRR